MLDEFDVSWEVELEGIGEEIEKTSIVEDKGYSIGIGMHGTS